MSAPLRDLLVPPVQLLALTGLAPLFAGALDALRAALVGGAPPPLLARYAAIAKRLRRSPSPPAALGDAAAAIVLGATVAALGLVPAVTAAAPAGAAGGPIAFVGLLALGRAAEALAGIASGDPLAARGASRSAVLGSLSEPSLLLALAAVALAARASEMGRMAARTATASGLLLTPGLLLAALAMAVVVLVETSRLPRPGLEAGTELALFGEGTRRTASAPALALLELAGEVRAVALGTLLVNLFVPVGMAAGTAPGALALGALALLIKLAALVLVLAASGAGLARLRLLRLPELLGAAFALGLLALVFVTIPGGGGS